MTLSPFMVALAQLCDEKGLPKETVIKTVESALAAAYRKEYGNSRQIIRAELNEEDLAKTKMFQVFNVVEEEEFKDENNQMKLAEAKKHKKKAKIGDEIVLPLPSKSDFGRIAAQTAKQVIVQRLQEAERNMLLDEFRGKEGQLVNSTIQQVDGSNVIVNLGKINALMPTFDQIRNERYYSGQRLKVYVVKVEESNRGPRIIISRSHPELIKGLFTSEVPEIAAGTVEIKGIAREAGSRTKMAVIASQEGLDPVGSCVGQRGIRVQAVLAEIGEEKIDIILWDKDTQTYISNALSPAKISKITLNKKQKKAKVYVGEDQLSLAIGRNGQNVRLASKLTGWGIDIMKAVDKKTKTKKEENKETSEETRKEPKDEKAEEQKNQGTEEPKNEETENEKKKKNKNQ